MIYILFIVVAVLVIAIYAGIQNYRKSIRQDFFIKVRIVNRLNENPTADASKELENLLIEREYTNYTLSFLPLLGFLSLELNGKMYAFQRTGEIWKQVEKE